MKFEEKVTTGRSKKELLVVVKEFMKDSRKSKIWPNNLEILKSQGFKKGSIIKSSYKTPIGVKTFRYKIIRADKNGLIYQTMPDHIFQGKGKIIFKNNELNWSGNFNNKKPNPLVFFFFHFFRKRFFKALRENFQR